MTIVNIYKKNRCFPWGSLAVVLACFLVTGIAVARPELYESLAWSKYPVYPWQYVSGAFLHGTGGDLPLTVMHLVANLLMFLPYAVLLEGMLGHKKFGLVFLASWLGISLVFQGFAWLAVPAGEAAYGAGLSGSSYAVIAMGAYVLFCLFRRNKGRFFRQPLAYVFLSGLLGEVLILLPMVAGIGSMVIHLAGIFIGAIMTFLYRSTLRAAME